MHHHAHGGAHFTAFGEVLGERIAYRGEGRITVSGDWVAHPLQSGIGGPDNLW